MVTVGSEIRRRREKLGWSVTKLATLAGISGPFLSRIEHGKSYYSHESLLKICGALGISLETFYGSLAGDKSNVVDAEIGWRRIPVLDYVQAGAWRGVVLPGESEHIDTIPTDLEHPPSTFAMKIRGDSMLPKFQEGDVVVICPPIPPRPGDFVMAVDENGEATFKQYREVGKNAQGMDVFELVPLNDHHPRWRSDVQQIAIVGTMVEHRQYRKR